MAGFRQHGAVWRGLILMALLLPSACEPPGCSAGTCAQGCCQGGACYEGTSVKGGAACGSGATECAALHSACNATKPCCATDPVSRKPLRCSLYCEEACGGYNDPCNANLCCATGYVCKNERCDSCIGKGVDCSYSFQRDRCCPGAQCLLKPGFTTVYECQ